MALAKEQIRQIINQNDITSVTDVYSVLKESFKDILQELMEAELDATLGYEKNQKGDVATDNKRNGHSPKTLKSQFGEFQIDVPRDRNGEFEPKLIPKYQRDVSGIEEKVLSLYARGMSTRDIHDQLQDLYGIELSAEMVSKITDRFCSGAAGVSSFVRSPDVMLFFTSVTVQYPHSYGQKSMKIAFGNGIFACCKYR